MKIMLVYLAILFFISKIFAATIITNENFELGAVGWSNNTTVDGGSNFSKFLGQFSATGGAQTIYKTYSLSSGLKTITIQFDFYEIDSWDGESFYIYINDSVYQTNQFWVNSHYSNEDKPSNAVVINGGTYDLGFNNTYSDEIFRYTIILTDTNITSLKLGFGTSLNEVISNESWGIDNVLISANYAIPEPATIWLGLFALMGIIKYRRSQK